jgi:hypothetical protein
MDAARPIAVRQEQPGDAAAVHRVVAAAFKGRTEADLVDKLRANGRFDAGSQAMAQRVSRALRASRAVEAVVSEAGSRRYDGPGLVRW